MKEISIKNIGNFSLNELSDYYFNTTTQTVKIANEKIKNIGTTELLHLIRRDNYTDLAVLLAIYEFETNGFYGYSFNYDDVSTRQQDLLKELMILNSNFWTYNQKSFHQLKPIAEANAIYVNLAENIVNMFLSIKPEPIIWSNIEIDKMISMAEMDTASTVHYAWEMIRQLKRVVDDGTKVIFNWEGNVVDIENETDIKKYIVKLLPHASDFLKVIEKEVRILR
ncbi:MAG: hypothetical protein ACXWEY_09460 [Bacteroidia bacterium]